MFWTERAIKTLNKAFAGGSGSGGSSNSGLGVVGAAKRANNTATNPYTRGTAAWEEWNRLNPTTDTLNAVSGRSGNDFYHTTDYGEFRAMPKLGPVMPRMQVGGLNLAEWNKRYGR